MVINDVLRVNILSSEMKMRYKIFENIFDNQGLYLSLVCYSKYVNLCKQLSEEPFLNRYLSKLYSL